MELQTTPPCDLCFKISRLIQKHGWNLEDFARKAKLNRHTVRKILRGTPHRLRRATLSACASALGLTVSELREHSLEVLLTRVNNQEADKSGSSVLRRYETASQPELQAWLERHRDRAKKLDAEEMYELLSLQGVGGPLTETGVEHFIAQIESPPRVGAQSQDHRGNRHGRCAGKARRFDLRENSAIRGSEVN